MAALGLVTMATGGMTSGSPVGTSALAASEAAKKPRKPVKAILGLGLQVYAAFDQCPAQPVTDINSDKPSIPASLTKIMVQYIAARAIKDPDLNIDFDTRVEVTPFVMEKSAGLASYEAMKVGDSYRLGDLLIGSGANSDARSTIMIALAVTEALGWEGSELERLIQFVDHMDKTAERLGMTHSDFLTVTGKDGEHSTNVSSPRDITNLVNAFYSEAPTTFRHTLGQSTFRIPMTDKTFPSSRLLRGHPDYVIGAKTGKLNSVGFNEAAKVRFTNSDMTGIIVVFGAATIDRRAVEVSGQYSKMAELIKLGKACPS